MIGWEGNGFSWWRGRVTGRQFFISYSDPFMYNKAIPEHFQIIGTCHVRTHQIQTVLHRAFFGLELTWAKSSAERD
jgi:hypothetical protein